MPLDQYTRHELGILEQVLARLWGLTTLYQHQIFILRNQKIRETLARFAQEKNRQAKDLEALLLRLGGNPVKVRIPSERLVSTDRELIPRIYQEEQDLSLWCQARIDGIKQLELKEFVQSLLEDEERQIGVLKELYRDVTHC
jgi:rubrerythrin